MGRILRGLLGRLALLFVATSIALGVGEVLVRLIRPQQLRRTVVIYRPLDSLGVGLTPNLDTDVYSGEGAAHLRTDAEGYRVGPQGRREAETKVLVLGDSFMEALQVPYQESLAGQLEARLSADLGRPVAARVFAVSGYSPSHYLIAADHALARERYDLILVGVFVGNDVVGQTRNYFPAGSQDPAALTDLRWPRSAHRAEIYWPLIYPVARVVRRHSHLAELAWSSTELVRARLGLPRATMPWIYRRDRADAADWSTTASVLAQIAERVGPSGPPVAYVVIPTYLQTDPNLFWRCARAIGTDSTALDPEQPIRILSERLKERGLVVFNTLPALREATVAGIKTYGDVDRHWSKNGHAVAAGLIESFADSVLKAAVENRTTTASRGKASDRPAAGPSGPAG